MIRMREFLHRADNGRDSPETFQRAVQGDGRVLDDEVEVDSLCGLRSESRHGDNITGRLDRVLKAFVGLNRYSNISHRGAHKLHPVNHIRVGGPRRLVCLSRALAAMVPVRLIEKLHTVETAMVGLGFGGRLQQFNAYRRRREVAIAVELVRSDRLPVARFGQCPFLIDTTCKSVGTRARTSV